MNQTLIEKIKKLEKACLEHCITVSIHGEINKPSPYIFIDNKCEENRKEAKKIMKEHGGVAFISCKKDFDMLAVLPKLIADAGIDSATLLTSDPTHTRRFRGTKVNVTPEYLSTEINGKRTTPQWQCFFGMFVPSMERKKCSPA